MDKAEQSNAPLDTVRDRALKATIWKNESERGSYLTIKFAKTYEDPDGNLRDGSGFSPDEALRVSELARRAFNRAQELSRDLRQSQEPHASLQSERAPRNDAPDSGQRRYGRSRAEPRQSRRNAPDQAY